MTLPQPSPGSLLLLRGVPNPHGEEETQLFLFVGDPTVAPIREVLPAGDVSVPPPPEGLAARPFQLCIFHFSDLHGNVSRLTPDGSQAVFSRMVWRLRRARRHSHHNPDLGVLFLSGGDDLAGAAFDELLGDDPDSYVVHAGYRLYSAAGVDAGVLGNHDFDQGTDLLAHAIGRDARFPLLSANLQAAPHLADRVFPAALLVVKGIRVGLIGLTTSAEINRRRGSEFAISHPITAVQNLVPALRPLCDVLIVLSHLGHSLGASTAPTRDAGDVELAQSLPPGSVHLIVGGHTHQALNEAGLSIPNVVNGIPIVEAGSMGRFLGEVDLTVGRRAAVTSAHLTATADLPVDEEFERQEVQPLLELAAPVFAEPLGQVGNHPDLTTEVVRNYFAARELALANFITDALVAGSRAAGHPVDLAAIDATAIHGGLPVGCELTSGDWFQVMPYADTVRLYRLTGRQLAALLDDNARRVDRSGEPHVERGFLQFSQQVRYTIELGEGRPAARAIQIEVDGLPLDDQLDRTFLVACTNFVREAAASWEQHAVCQLPFPVLEAVGPVHTDTDLFVRDLMLAHIRERGGVTEETGARRDGRLRIL
jgi:2',3'-cyclic-nucleotide 2'-phosphodiesterase (5'-nucleotidase family)